MLIVALVVMVVALLFFVGGSEKMGRKFTNASKEVSNETGGVVDIIKDTSLGWKAEELPPNTYTTTATSSPEGRCHVQVGGEGEECRILVTATIDDAHEVNEIVELQKDESKLVPSELTPAAYGRCKVTMLECYGTKYKYVLEEV